MTVAKELIRDSIGQTLTGFTLGQTYLAIQTETSRYTMPGAWGWRDPKETPITGVIVGVSFLKGKRKLYSILELTIEMDDSTRECLTFLYY